jgi:hypothetical protein
MSHSTTRGDQHDFRADVFTSRDGKRVTYLDTCADCRWPKHRHRDQGEEPQT